MHHQLDEHCNRGLDLHRSASQQLYVRPSVQPISGRVMDVLDQRLVDRLTVLREQWTDWVPYKLRSVLKLDSSVATD